MDMDFMHLRCGQRLASIREVAKHKCPVPIEERAPVIEDGETTEEWLKRSSMYNKLQLERKRVPRGLPWNWHPKIAEPQASANAPAASKEKENIAVSPPSTPTGHASVEKEKRKAEAPQITSMATGHATMEEKKRKAEAPQLTSTDETGHHAGKAEAPQPSTPSAPLSKRLKVGGEPLYEGVEASTKFLQSLVARTMEQNERLNQLEKKLERMEKGVKGPTETK